MTKQFHPIAQCNDGVVNTSSGKIIDLKNPTTDMIDIKDIANGLSKICRFGGQVTHYYSVAQHSVLVCYLMKEGEGKYELEALLHDASETYLGDVVKPLKVMIGNVYKSLEDGFSNIISEKYKLIQSPETESLIKKYDLIALELEHEAFQKGNSVPLLMTMDRLGLYSMHLHWDCNEARIMFLACFADCCEAREGKETNGLLTHIKLSDLVEELG